MVSSIKHLINSRDTRRKLELMFLVIAAVRILSQIPVPGVDATVLKSWLQQNSNDAFNLFSAMTGGSFENFSVMALGITPYITASIIIQLMSVVIPTLASWQKNGESGKKMTEKVTAILGVLLALMQSCAMAIGFGKNGMIADINVWKVLSVTVFMTVGTGLCIYLGHILTEKSIGNGASVLIMINIMSRIPSMISSLFSKDIVKTLISIAVMVIVVLFVVYMGEGVRNIPVQYARKMSPTGEEGYIPVKVNLANVIPVIFASSVMAVPQLVASVIGKGYGSGYSKMFLEMLSQANWINKEHPVYILGMFMFLVLIAFFAWFYTPIVFNPMEIAENIRKQSGVIPGVRLGTETESCLETVSNCMTFIGTAMMLFVIIIPIACSALFGVDVNMGGTSIVIVVGVALEIVQQISLEMAGTNYTGFIRREQG